MIPSQVENYIKQFLSKTESEVQKLEEKMEVEEDQIAPSKESVVSESIASSLRFIRMQFGYKKHKKGNLAARFKHSVME